MCGIAGIISKESGGTDLRVLNRMTDAIVHRGPDADGHWRDDTGRVALGHRRLSIIDLSACGAQPMHYMERYSIIFNGEIYNYVELREALLRKGHSFHSHTDTEVIMALYHDAGVDCLQQMDGMFAFALYDRKEHKFFIARDRFGEKPLYYAFTDKGNLLFGSEMKALWAAGLPKVVNNNMLYNYLAHGQVEDAANKQATFYSNISRLPAAHYVLEDVRELTMIPQRYWNINPAQRNNDISVAETAEEFRRLFRVSVDHRLRSDVPVGSSLSGGFDSSLVVSVIDDIDKERAITRKTFSAQFPGFIKDESRYQQMVIDRCHVEPHFVHPTAESMLANLDKIMLHQEEPFVSASICAQYEVYGLARANDVIVCLDGQGADEILAGYHSYYAPYFAGLKKNNPKQYAAEHKAYIALQADNTINTQHKRGWKERVKQLVPAGVQDKLLKGKRQAYSGEALLAETFTKSHALPFATPTPAKDLQEALYQDTTATGLENLLRYADRNAMAFSLEVRLPFLYHPMVEFLFSLPDHFKIHDGWTKWIMREAFQDVVPKEIVWRKDKIGYEPPQAQWLLDERMKKAIENASTALADHKIIRSTQLADMSQTMQWKVFAAANILFA